MSVFQELALVTSFWSIIEYDNEMYGCKNYIPAFEEQYGEFLEWLVNDECALVLKSDRNEINVHVNWVKDPVEVLRQEKTFVSYGNECYADHAYHNVSLIVEVGKPGNRGNQEPIGHEDNYDENEGAVEAQE
jgi:hypothetical protein